MITVVPAGKRLVIEYVSMFAHIPAGEVAILQIETIAGGVVQFHALNPSTPSVNFVGTPLAVIGQQVRLYADPQSLVGVSAVRSSSAGTADFDITISGYLVDLP